MCSDSQCALLSVREGVCNSHGKWSFRSSGGSWSPFCTPLRLTSYMPKERQRQRDGVQVDAEVGQIMGLMDKDYGTDG